MISRRDALKCTGVATLATAAFYAFPSVLNSRLSLHQAASGAKPNLPIFNGSESIYKKMLFIGDSNSAGKGQYDGFRSGTMGLLSRSIINHADALLSRDMGSSYVSLMSPYQEFIAGNGWSGSIPDGYAAGGAADAWAVMKAGSWMEITRDDVATVNFSYDPSQSSGATWAVSVDGEVVKSGVAEASGMTGDIEIPRRFSFRRTSRKVRLSCTSGSLFYQSAEIFDSGRAQPPHIWCAPQGSQAFEDFATQQRLSSIAPSINYREGKTLICALLGSNNFLPMSVQHVPPKEYITQMSLFVDKWNSEVTGEKMFALVIPPKPRLKLPFGEYEEYAARTVEFAEGKSDVSVIRTDLSILGGDDTEKLYSSDGIHLNYEGHPAWAKVCCHHFGVHFDGRTRVATV